MSGKGRKGREKAEASEAIKRQIIHDEEYMRKKKICAF